MAGLRKENEELKGKVKKLTEEVAEYKERVLYALAEAENARRIAAKDVDSARQFAVQGFAKQLLDVADNLERAIETMPASKLDQDADLKTLFAGVVGTDKELKKAFKNAGLEPFGQIGDVCDPNKYEALFQVPDASKPANSVVQVLRKGYTLNKRVLRAAQVGSSIKG